MFHWVLLISKIINHATRNCKKTREIYYFRVYLLNPHSSNKDTTWLSKGKPSLHSVYPLKNHCFVSASVVMWRRYYYCKNFTDCWRETIVSYFIFLSLFLNIGTTIAVSKLLRRDELFIEILNNHIKYGIIAS